MPLPVAWGGGAVRLDKLHAKRRGLKAGKDVLTKSLESAPDDLRAGEELANVASAPGRTADAEKIARERLARFPLSGFLKEKLGKPNILHLASDSYSVLNVASEYARLGVYRRAGGGLSRDYPSPEAGWSAPGGVFAHK